MRGEEEETGAMRERGGEENTSEVVRRNQETGGREEGETGDTHIHSCFLDKEGPDIYKSV